jgi:hypothetical protein
MPLKDVSHCRNRNEEPKRQNKPRPHFRGRPTRARRNPRPFYFRNPEATKVGSINRSSGTIVHPLGFDGNYLPAERHRETLRRRLLGIRIVMKPSEATCQKRDAKRVNFGVSGLPPLRCPDGIAAKNSNNRRHGQFVNPRLGKNEENSSAHRSCYPVLPLPLGGILFLAKGSFRTFCPRKRFMRLPSPPLCAIRGRALREALFSFAFKHLASYKFSRLIGALKRISPLSNAHDKFSKTSVPLSFPA